MKEHKEDYSKALFYFGAWGKNRLENCYYVVKMMTMGFLFELKQE